MDLEISLHISPIVLLIFLGAPALSFTALCGVAFYIFNFKGE